MAMPRKFNCDICGKEAQSYQNRTIYCSKECHAKSVKINNKRRYREDIEYNRKRVRDWARNCRKNRPNAYLYSSAKTRARKKGLEFNIELEDVIVPKICPILKIPIKSHNKLCGNSITLDRIDNSKGYIKENVMVISWRANRLKGDASLKELEKIVKWLKQIIKNNKE